MVEFDARFVLATPERDLDLAGLLDSDLIEGDAESIVLHGASAEQVARTLLLYDGIARSVHLVPADVALPSMPIAASGCEPSRDSTTWLLYTSGTTGDPKAVGHSLSSLTRTLKKSTRTARLHWGLMYDPSRMAGLQVLLQAIVSGARLSAPDSGWAIREKAEWMRRRGVTALSATPTMWRQVLQSGAGEGWNLEQVTLGGEIADQKILNAVRIRFPRARISHVFAATETGAAFTINDGLAGFPRSMLGDSANRRLTRVVDGMLEIFVPRAGSDGDGSWVSTGDRVALQGDRVVFLGRASGAVNVAGAMVYPEQVEQLLRGHDQVVDAVVTARPNPFSGNILMAEVAATPDVDADLPAKLRGWVKDQAPNHWVPARIRVVEQLSVSRAGKVSRR